MAPAGASTAATASRPANGRPTIRPCAHGRSLISIDADGTVYPCVATVGRIIGGNAARDGVAAAWRRLHDHRCVACYAPCLVEQNQLLALRPGPLVQFVRRHLGRYA